MKPNQLTLYMGPLCGAVVTCLPLSEGDTLTLPLSLTHEVPNKESSCSNSIVTTLPTKFVAVYVKAKGDAPELVYVETRPKTKDDK